MKEREEVTRVMLESDFNLTEENLWKHRESGVRISPELARMFVGEHGASISKVLLDGIVIGYKSGLADAK